jgi:hypothetical protein
MFVIVYRGLKNVYFLQLRNYDMCIAKNEEAIAINPRFAECYGNMANAWKVYFWSDYYFLIHFLSTFVRFSSRTLSFVEKWLIISIFKFDTNFWDS